MMNNSSFYCNSGTLTENVTKERCFSIGVSSYSFNLHYNVCLRYQAGFVCLRYRAGFVCLRYRAGFKMAAYTKGIGTTLRKTKHRSYKSLRLFSFCILMLYLLQKFH